FQCRIRSMEKKNKARLVWVELYQSTKDAGLVCCRCGISRPTLRKWVRRYAVANVAGLLSHSRRPHRSPHQNVGRREEQVVLALRRERQLGIKRLRNELIRLHDLRLSVATIHKILVRHEVSRLVLRRW